ncbi:sodium:proton exchanger [Natronococcus pandeyae]|uniref:Sodium:proton exchanger n=1 Tax=Natronococcus pandeyae TaxID=2055836 RepID=A0A8J8TT13_9EURY|nr:cation:proton antiporter [Natronococcus pandeyae]TYL39172.1 sodium:proton exchanger [Natronococcus pandeyae]
MSEFEFIAALTLIFVVAAALLLLATHYSLPTVPFYLLAGVAVGLFVDEGQLLDLAQWGIAFLVFAFAVELDPLEGGGLRRDSTIVSVVQLLVTGLIMYGVGLGIGLDGLNALYFTLAATLSSSLVALSLLERRIRLRSLHERMAESIHFVEDVVAIGTILLLSAFVYTEGSLLALATGVALIGAALLFRQFLFDRFVTAAESDVEILMLTGVSLIIGFIALAELVGVSIVVGAFAAGLAVASEYPHDVEMVDAIGYLEDFFTPIFFITLGALVSIPTVETLGIGALLLFAVFVLNPMVTYLVLRWREYDSRTATLTGYNLDQVSEFALIIAIEALVAGLLVPELFDAIVLAAIVTMFGSTVTERYAEAGFQRLVELDVFESDTERVRERSQVRDGLEDHVIVTGYDREGQQVVEACESIDQSYVVLESDPTREEAVKDHCENYVLGDVMTTSTWTVANAEEAGLIVGTVARESWAEQILALDIDADIMVRAVDVESGADLLEQGALFVAIPDELAAERLKNQVEAVLTGEVSREELREQGEERLERAVEYGPSDVQRLR